MPRWIERIVRPSLPPTAAVVGDEVTDAPPRRRWAYLSVALISTVVVSSWFRAGTFISTGDMGSFIRRGWAPEMAWSWNHQVSGAGSAAHTIGRAFEFFLIDITSALGFDETVAQWLFYTIIYGAVGVGVAYATAAVVRNNLAVVVAGTFGVLNGFFLTRLPNPLNIISVATVALMTGVALRVAQGKRIPAPVAGLVFLPTSFLAFNPPMFVVAAAWATGGTLLLAALLVGRKGVWRLIKWQFWGAPWVVLLNAWWIVPFIQAYTGGGGAEANASFTDPTNWSWSQVNNQVPNIITMVANWAWYKPQYLPFAAGLDSPWWIWVRYLLPMLVLLAPVVALRRRRRTAFMVLGLSGVFVFLAKGLMPPLTSVNMWLYLNAPGFWLFREPMSKLGQVLVIMFGILLALFVEGLVAKVDLARARAPLARMTSLAGRIPIPLPRPAAIAGALGALAVLLALAYPHPLATGAVIPDERPLQPSAHVRVPQFWRQMAEKVDADPRPGKVLVLPLDDYYQMPTTWGFFGVDSIANLLIKHPVVTPKPDGYFGDTPGFKAEVTAIETGLVSGDLAGTRSLMDAAGISDVIIRHDLVRGLPARTFADDRVLTSAIARVPGMTREVDGPLELWRVGDGTSPTVRLYDRTLAVGSRPEAGAGVVGSMGTGTTILAEKSKTKAPINPSIDNAPSVTDDSVQWPVPAVDAGPATTEFSLQTAGTFRVAQRSRAGAVLTPRLDPAGSNLVFEDPTSVVLDGAAVSRRPPLKLPTPRPDLVAVKAGTRTVSLDNWNAPAGQPGNPAGTLIIASATDVVAYAPSAKPASLTTPSDVYDCNNYEPRPTKELGLVKEPLVTPGGSGIRLKAKDHAACSRIVVRNPTHGDVLRVRLEYRQVTGKRPQICVWQVGLQGCDLAARAGLGNQWVRFEQFVPVDQLAAEVQLVLHADVGERLLPETITDYRNITIEALTPALKTVAWPPEVPAVSVSLAAGKHTLSVVGGPSGDILRTFEPLQDCFRYDDQTIDEAGLKAEVGGDPDNPTFSLAARDHMACLGATAANMGGSSLYELSLDAQSVALRNPKFCLFLRGPDRCEKLPVAAQWKGWTTYQVFVRPDPDAVETRLYLYGLRDLKGQNEAKVEYRNVKLRPVASPVSVVLVRAPATGVAGLDAPRLRTPDWKQTSPVSFSVKGVTGPGMLSLTETFAPGWTFPAAKGGHVASGGWMNGWQLKPGDVSGTISYAPAKTSRYALMLLPVAALAALVWTWFSVRRSRRALARGAVSS